MAVVDWEMPIDEEEMWNENEDFSHEPWQRRIASIEFGSLEKNDSGMRVIPETELFHPT
jgi:hypothetical protein